MMWMLFSWVIVCVLSGCFGQPFQIELLNKGIFPITEVLVYPDAGLCGTPGPQAHINRLPNNASGSAIALQPEETAILPQVFRPDVYLIAVTFYDTRSHVLRQAVSPSAYDLSFVKGAYPVVVRAAMDENGIPDFELEFVTRF